MIREEFPETAVMVLTAHVEVEQAMDLLAGGQRSGYLLKSQHVRSILMKLRLSEADDMHRRAAHPAAGCA